MWREHLACMCFCSMLTALFGTRPMTCVLFFRFALNFMRLLLERATQRQRCQTCSAEYVRFYFLKLSLQASCKGAASKAVTPPGKRDDETDEVTVVLMKSECKVAAAPPVKPIEKKKMPVGGFHIFTWGFCILCSIFLCRLHLFSGPSCPA